MPRYRISGLFVLSEIELPGLISAQEELGEPDVDIRFGPVPEKLDNPTHRGPIWEIDEDRCLLRILDIARFLIVEGRHIVVEALPNGKPDDLAIFVIGGVFGMLLHQRGRVVLHASTVAVNGNAVLFCGPSGAGKSTLAAALNQRGYPLVSDDLCAISLDASGTPVVYPDGRQLKLWMQTVKALDLGDQRGKAVRAELEKYYIEPAVAAIASPLVVAAVYILRRERAPLSSGIEAPRLVDAARQLQSNAYRPTLVRRLGQSEIYFRAAAAIANRGGIFWLTRKLAFSAMPTILDSLESHWSERGWMGPT